MCLWELRVWVCMCVCFGACVAVSVRVCVCLWELRVWVGCVSMYVLVGVWLLV